MNIPELLYKFAHNQASPEELREFAIYLESLDADQYRSMLEQYGDVIHSITIDEPANMELFEVISARIKAIEAEEMPRIDPVHTIPFIRRFRIAAAAILLLIAGATYLIIADKNNKQTIAVAKYKGDIAPGKEGARLKLLDGRIILIDTVKDGLIAYQGKIKVYKENGKIVYKGTTDEIIYNEIITDKGQQTSAILPDGSAAWLNAASSIRYPLHFASDERLVTMTGEASFRAVHNTAQPFRVKVKDQVTEDVGTEFNINAYDDEAVIKTTVIEGTVKTAGGFVHAGEEASINSAGIKISKADVDAAIAWRKGLFSFKDADIQTVMKQLSRWYDVEVRYEGEANPVHDITGEMGRGLTLSQALNVLGNMRIHYRIEEDKRIVIMP